jgi:hypothetical protein
MSLHGCRQDQCDARVPVGRHRMKRTAEAFRVRRDGGDAPDHGAIAIQAQADYAANPAGLGRGKDVIGRLTALLQQELGTNPRIFFSSQHLESAGLQALARDIWPPAQ